MGLVSDQIDQILNLLIPKNLQINPDRISYATLVLSLLFRFIPNPLILGLILLFDSLDGYFARKIGKNDKIIDYACDRVSEMIIFISSTPWLLASLLNVWISIIAIERKVPVIPLRHLYLLLLILKI